MDFIKNAAKLAQEMQGGGGGHGNASHGGRQGGLGDLMGAAEGMFAQHTTTTTTTHRPASNYNDEYSGPDAMQSTTTHVTSTHAVAPHQRPSTGELMSSGQALFHAASGGGNGDPTKLAGAASNLLAGLADYGGLNKTPYGSYVQQASTFLEGYGHKPGSQGAPSGAGGGMEGPGAYYGTNQQHLSDGPAYGGQDYGGRGRPHKSQAAQYEGAEYGSQGRPHEPQYQSADYGGQGRPHQSQAPHYPVESDEFGGQGRPRPSEYASESAGHVGQGRRRPSEYASESAGYGEQGRPRPSEYASESAGYGGQGQRHPQSQEYGDEGRPQRPQAAQYPPEGAEYYDQGPSHPQASAGQNKPSWYQ